MDKEDDKWDPANWIKANPLVCKDKEDLENLVAVGLAAKDTKGEDLLDFETKALNQWVQYSDRQYMNMEHWKACATDLTLEDFKGMECYVGLDLSSGGDLTSLAFEFPYFKVLDKKFFIHSHSFMPAKRVKEHEDSDDAPYRLWIKDKLITVTETLGGIKTDYKYIIAYLKEQVKKYNLKVKMICYDPHNADAFLSDLEELGYDTMEIVPSAKNLNDATVDFRLETEAGNVEYDRKNELLTWSMANAKTVSNSFKEIKIDKDLGVKRIDPIDAVLDAHKMAFKAEIKIKSVYEDRGVLSFDL